MSELLPTAGPLTDSPSVLPELPGINTASLDANLRTISQLERTWRLPSLPDGVKLDLAGYAGMSPDTLTSFMSGLDSDLNGDNQVTFEQELPPLSVVPSFGTFGPLSLNSYKRASSLVAQLAGDRPMDVPDLNAVQRWKMRAIELGYLERPADGVVDGKWTEDLYPVQREMMFGELNSRYRGDRAGSLPIASTNDREGVLDILHDWTSPSGLMRMAVDLDFWFDGEQIGKEFSSWGDKWRKVSTSSGPLDFTKKLIDAATGPLDDIVVPILNLGILITGIGSMFQSARIGATGARAAMLVAEAGEGMAAASTMYRAGRVSSALSRVPLAARMFPAAEDVAQLGRASWTAEKLMASRFGSVSKVGESMAAWRGLGGVIKTRRAVQTGMRLGILAQAEQTLLPSYSGFGLGDIEPVGRVSDTVLKNPYVSDAADIMFAPYNVFAPGTFTGAGRDAVGGAFKYLGQWQGRAAVGFVAGVGLEAKASAGEAGDDWYDPLVAGAAGAAALGALPGVARGADKVAKWAKIPLISKAVSKTARFGRALEWAPVGDNERLTNIFFDAMRAKMDPEEFTTFEGRVRDVGFKTAFAERIGTDETSVGGVMYYVMVSAAVDHAASLQAGATAARDSQAYWNRYFLFRNKMVAQMRTFGDAVTPEELAWAIVSKESTKWEGISSRYDKYLEWIKANPDKMAEAIAHHNDQARLTMQQLFENVDIDGLTDLSRQNMGALSRGIKGDDMRPHLVEYVSNALDSFGNWGRYQGDVTDLGSIVRSGLFQDARIKPAVSYMGTRAKVSIVDFVPEMVPDIVELPGDWGLISRHINDTLFVDSTASWDELRRAGFHINPLAAEISPTRSRFSLQRITSRSKQDLMVMHDELRRVQFAFNHLNEAKRWVDREGRPVVSGLRRAAMTPLHEATQAQLASLLTAAGFDSGSKTYKAVQEMRRVLIRAKELGYDVSDAPEMALRRFVDDLSRNDPRWLELGLPEHVYDASGRSLSGLELLKSRAEAVRQLANRTAAEVDVDDLVRKLEEAGKLDERDRLVTLVESLKQAHPDGGPGYRIVYGQEFMMPDELHQLEPFADLTERHMNAMTLGNFFGRRQPAQLAYNVQRARQRSVAREMSKVLGEEIDPSDSRVQYALEDVYRLVLDPELERNRSLMEDVYHQGFVGRAGTSIKASSQARNIQDLGLLRHRKKVVEALATVGYSDEVANAVWAGIKQGRYSEWSDLGLAAIEQKLRGSNQIIGSMKVLGSTLEGEKLLSKGGAGKVLKAVGKGALIGLPTGAIAGQATAEERDAGVGEWVTGALAGTAAGTLASLGLGAAAERINPAGWARYGYLADGIADWRDRMRFTLSPFFDLSRYTEAHLLNNIAAPRYLEDGRRVMLPMNQSPSKLRKTLMKQFGSAEGQRRFSVLMDDWASASRGKFNVEEIEQTTRMFEELGILGFNPTRWMASTFHYLREAGMDSERAYESVRDMYTYGINSRSPAELSVNFIFFPFSFSKKTVKHAAEFLTDNTMRSVLLHDAYKAYELLDQHYDLNEWAKEHMPVLEQMNRLNLFGYGLSVGRLGGINKPFLDVAFGGPSGIMNAEDRRGLVFNLFNPVGINLGMSGGVTKDQLETLVRKTLPAIGDIQYMLDDLKSQGHVLFDPSHKVRWAQSREASQQWNEYKTGIEAALTENGLTWSDLYNMPELAGVYSEYKAKRYELEQQYPGWKEVKDAAIERSAERESIAAGRRVRVESFPEEATETDKQFVYFEDLVTELKNWLADNTGSADLDNLSAEQQAKVRAVATDFVAVNPAFLPVYKDWYERYFGPIVSEVR